jgi:biotin carboxyl carrier protein
MKKYNISVNGTTYEVEVEEVGGEPRIVSAAAQAAPAKAEATQADAPAKDAPAPAAPAQSAPSDGAATVESPMPGTILDILVSPGQAVANGEVILILEAMKMENEIVSPQAGTIDAVLVAKGATVNAGDVLISIK